VNLNEQEIKTYLVNTDTNGAFSLTTDKFKISGVMDIFAVNIITDKIKSLSSDKIQIKVNNKDMIKFSLHKDLLLGGSALIFVLLLLMLAGWIKYFRLKHGLRSLKGHNPIEDIYNATF